MGKDKAVDGLTLIYLDGARLDYEDTESDATLGDLVKAIEGEMQSLKRIVSELAIDGEDCEHWRTEELMAGKLADFKELKFVTGSFEDFVVKAVDTLQEYIKVMRENIGASVAVLRRGEGYKPELLISIIEGIVQIMTSIDELSRGMSKMGVNTFKENPSVYYAPLLKHMEDLEAARGGGDSLLVADILEYEILPILGDMDEKLFHSGVS
ncbi:hypothetical protein MNBD_DELTA01-342 [hydrothermal vent metagenome]|uniref:Uncharacterized protein n=1 Tax=hydrothermal vent metagenome TaxID=652676 RepID=A0A3B0RC49_9ZZZZ